MSDPPPNGAAHASNGAGHPGEAGRDAFATDGFAPLPGDTISLPDDERAIGQTVYLCAEPGIDEVSRWSWIVLEDGRLLEIAPRGCALYDPPNVLARRGGRFLELAARDGALVRFEERVRAGTWQARPVRLSLGRRRWRVTSTGTVTAQRLGPVPEGGWGQLRSPLPPVPSPAHGRTGALDSVLPLSTAVGRGLGGGASPEPGASSPDVYFTFAGLRDADALGIGLWATDIILAFGRRLGDAPASAGLRVVS
jgi:hypothetical protein